MGVYQAFLRRLDCNDMEVQIVHRFLEDKNSIEISSELGLTQREFAAYVDELYKKLNIQPITNVTLNDRLWDEAIGFCPFPLSRREWEVAKLMARGRTIKEISAILNLAEGSVIEYRRRLYDKLEPTIGVRDKGALSAWVIEQIMARLFKQELTKNLLQYMTHGTYAYDIIGSHSTSSTNKWYSIVDEDCYIELSHEVTYNGRTSVKIVDNSDVGQAVATSELIPIEAGKRYGVSSQVYNISTSPSMLKIYITWWTHDYRRIRPSAIVYSNGRGKWQEVTVTGMAPEDAEFLSVWLVTGLAPKVTCYVNSIQLITYQESIITPESINTSHNGYDCLVSK